MPSGDRSRSRFSSASSVGWNELWSNLTRRRSWRRSPSAPRIEACRRSHPLSPGQSRHGRWSRCGPPWWPTSRDAYASSGAPPIGSPLSRAARSRSSTTCSRPPREVGLEPDEVRDGIERPEIKERLKANTEHALASGVAGIPTVAIGDDSSGATTASTKPRPPQRTRGESSAHGLLHERGDLLLLGVGELPSARRTSAAWRPCRGSPRRLNPRVAYLDLNLCAL